MEGGLGDSQQKRHKQTVARAGVRFIWGATDAICIMRVDMSHCPITAAANEGREKCLEFFGIAIRYPETSLATSEKSVSWIKEIPNNMLFVFGVAGIVPHVGGNVTL